MPTDDADAATAAVSLREIAELLERRYPAATAEDWDAVGLVCGDPAAGVRRVMLAVDPTLAVAEEALDWGADLLLTHHPLLLRAVHSVSADSVKGAVVHRLVRGGCALFAAHTNADAAAGGVAEALATAVGLRDLRPLVADAAGPAGTGTGRVGSLAEPMPLLAFGEVVAAALPFTHHGVRLAGDLSAPVRTVAVVGGAGDSLFDAVRASGADAYLTADLRHHPASEARELAELRDGGHPLLVDVSHWASEWLWLETAAATLRADVAAAGSAIETRVSALCTDPWTARLPSPHLEEGMTR